MAIVTFRIALKQPSRQAAGTKRLVVKPFRAGGICSSLRLAQNVSNPTMQLPFINFSYDYFGYWLLCIGILLGCIVYLILCVAYPILWVACLILGIASLILYMTNVMVYFGMVTVCRNHVFLCMAD